MKIATNQERLNELFDADPRNDTAIAAELDVSKQTISAWRKGIRSPKKPMLIRIAQLYRVSIEWLMGFDVERTPTGESEKAIENEEPQNDNIRLLIRGLNKLSEQQQEQALNVMRAMFAQYADYFEKESDDET